MSAEDKKDKTIEALNELFSDLSVSKRQTLELLEEVDDDLRNKIECLTLDIKHEEEE